MTEPAKETDARILIDSLLRDAGWDPADKAQVRTEVTAVATASDEVSSIIQDSPSDLINRMACGRSIMRRNWANDAS